MGKLGRAWVGAWVGAWHGAWLDGLGWCGDDVVGVGKMHGYTAAGPNDIKSKSEYEVKWLN